MTKKTKKRFLQIIHQDEDDKQTRRSYQPTLTDIVIHSRHAASPARRATIIHEHRKQTP
jgi:hypothetical protein